MSAAQRFSTDGLPPSDRLTFWTAGSLAIGGVEVEQVASQPFHGTVIRRTLGAAKVFGISTSPHRAAWTRRLIRQNQDSVPLRLCFQQEGSTVVISDGSEHVIRAGEWFISDGRRPYVSMHIEASRKIALQIPVNRLGTAEQDALRRLSSGIAVRGGIAQMLRDCLEALIADSGVGDERLDGDLGETMIDFFRLTLREQMSGFTTASMRDLTQERIRDFVRRHLGNPALSVDMIAQAMKCSKRYVHKVFSGDQTVSEYIWTQRLEQCRSILSSPSGCDITLTQLAFDNGFSSSAHFSRAFRDKYGIPPKVFRASVLERGSRWDKRAAPAATSQFAQER